MRNGMGLFQGVNRMFGRSSGASPTYQAFDGSTELQRVLVAGSGHLSTTVSPHHPLTCNGALSYTEDDTFACPHNKVTGDDPRTLSAITHSVTLLIIEIAGQTL